MNNREITDYVDIQAPPPGESALILFGTNQLAPVEIASSRYHQGLAPLIIATGGVNRHNGIVEGQVFRRLLLERDVPEEAIRHEYASVDTWANVEGSVEFLSEALSAGLSITAVSKWYHLRAIYALRKYLSIAELIFGLGWDPIYDGVPVTRASWPDHPGGKRRVIREWDEISRRISDGELIQATRGAGWR